jgi:hypothetical protein
MIKLFRNIRKALIAESKMGKYFQYAIGEIILVMVGILLALQVSNWNQQRIASQKEVLLLEALHNEFIGNQAQLELVIAKHERSMAHTQFAISHFPIDTETIDLDSLWEGMKHWGGWITFNPSQGVIRSLVNTSSFELITDPELRALLVSWEDVLVDYQEEEILAAHVLEDFLFTEIAKNMSWIYGVSDYHFDKNYLNTYEFENAFYRRRSTLRNILGWNDEEGEIVAIKATIDRIIELSKPKER